jgi:hypothetical protein
MEATLVKGTEFTKAIKAYNADGLDGLIKDTNISVGCCATVVNIATSGGTVINGEPVADYVERMRAAQTRETGSKNPYAYGFNSQS